MKLPFDENLSPRLVDSLSDLYLESHVHECGLGSATEIHLDLFEKRRDEPS